MKIKSPGILACVGFVALLYGASPASAQTVGAAQSFAVLGGSSVTAGGGGATVNGDVGVSPGTSITGPITVVPPFATHNNDASAIAARAATLTLYNSLAAIGGATSILPGLNGQSLVPGVYTTGAALLTNGAPLVLNGAGTYIFQVTSSLTTNVGSIINLNGVNPCSVFWQVTSLATLDGTSFPGTVVAQTGIHLGTGSSLTGRALAAAAGDVTMAGGNSVGGCSLQAPPPGCPPITLSPAPLPVGRVDVAYSQQITATGGTGPYTFTVVSGTLPVGLTLSSVGLLLGTPTTLGASPITIQATDGNGCPGFITFVMAAATCPVITFSPPTLPIGNVGVAYSQQITASGGTATFSVVGGTLPAGLTLSSGGLLSGTPTTLGSSPVTIEATDGNGCPGIILFAMAGAFAGIPTLSGWGLMTLMALIGVASIYRLRRI